MESKALDFKLICRDARTTAFGICKCQCAYTIADFVQGTLSACTWLPLSPRMKELESSVLCRRAGTASAGASKSVTYSDVWWKDIHNIVQVCRKHCFF